MPKRLRYVSDISLHSGRVVARYVMCPHCGGELHRYPRLAHPHGHRMYSRCLSCTYAAWEHEESAAILERTGS